MRTYWEKNRIWIAGIFLTELIHVTYRYALGNYLLAILANNVGRCGLFCFIMLIGDYIWANDEKIGYVIKQFFFIYTIGFLFHIFVSIISQSTALSVDAMKNFAVSYIKGTPGNIWVLHGALVFAICVAIYKSWNMNKKLVYCFGVVYSVIAIALMVYTNVVSKVIDLDNGIVMAIFAKISGSSRPSVIMGVPAMFLGYVSNELRIKKNIITYGCAGALFFMWCMEIVCVNDYLRIYNVFITLIGSAACFLIYLLLRNANEGKQLDRVDSRFFLMLFAVQNSLNVLANYKSLQQSMLWMCIYVVGTLMITAAYFMFKERTQRAKAP